MKGINSKFKHLFTRGRAREVTAAAAAAPAPESLFFVKLPLELRQEILTIAFGGRTLHAARLGRAGVGPEEEPERRGRPGRQWLGSVCHCELEDPENFGARVVCDQCARNRARRWSLQGVDPPECTIGALGWLLTSRQAYTEGLHILYGTNTFRISDAGRDVAWPGLPESRGRRSIRSVEVVFCVYGYAQHGNRSTPPPILVADEIPAALDTLKDDVLPNLLRLYIAIPPQTPRIQNKATAKLRFRKIADDVFPPFDRAARDWLRAGLRELEVGVPTSAFHATFTIGTEAGHRFQAPGWKPELDDQGQGAWCARKRIWRPVSGEDGDEEGWGYWVSETVCDMTPGWLYTMGRYWE